MQKKNIIAEVIQVEEGQIKVQILQQAGCSKGKACCSYKKQNEYLTIPTSKRYVIGSQLSIDIISNRLYKQFIITYLFPLLFFIIGALIGEYYQIHELVAMLFSIVCGFIGFVIARRKLVHLTIKYDIKSLSNKQFSPN